MDSQDSRLIPAGFYDFDWQRFHRRNDPESPWYDPSLDIPEDLGTNQDTGDDVRRRERMAEAMYEC